MPLNIDLLQILLHVFNFLLLTGGLTLLLFKPIASFLAQRKQYFADAERELAEKTAANERAAAEYVAKMEAARAEIAEMRTVAEKDIADLSKAALTHAHEKAQAMIMAAEQEAEERKEHILDAAQTEIGELVVTATQKLLSDTVTPERNAALYDEFIRLAEETVKAKRTNK